MTDQESAEIDARLDEEIEERNIEYHFDNLLKNIIGTHDLSDTCDHCIGHFMLLVQRHIDNRFEELEEPDTEGLSN
jgi:hypothetical protein